MPLPELPIQVPYDTRQEDGEDYGNVSGTFRGRKPPVYNEAQLPSGHMRRAEPLQQEEDQS